MLPDKELEHLRVRLEKTLNTKIRPKKIKAIRVNPTAQWQPPLYIEVDGYCRNLEKGSPNEKIIAIFEAVSFIVCTPERGFDNDLPYFFSREDVRQVIEVE